MNILMIALLNFCLIFEIEQSSFIDKIINDFERYSWFLVIEIKSSSYNGKIIVENNELFYYLNHSKHLDKEQYKLEIKDKLKHHLPIDIQDVSFCQYKIITNNKRVAANVKKGKDEFIKIYFDNGTTLKDDITDDERTAIIQKLFEWEIACKIDDETGYLVISR